MKIYVNYGALVERLEQVTGEKFSDRRIEAESGFRRATIVNIRKGRLKRIDFETLSKFAKFLRSCGVMVRASDLLTDDLDD